MHSYVRELKELYKKGKITRRHFLYYSTMLGLSTGAANAFLAACGTQATPTTAVSLPGTATKPAGVPTTAPTTAPAATQAATAAVTPTAAAAAEQSRYTASSGIQT